jgi:GNAT superfamily N-acetyltransferase
MDPRRIEEASLNAWPGRQQVLFDGWILRFAQGYTKRANSVTPLYSGRMALVTKVDVCERLYAAQRLPAIFRLTSFAAPPKLDELLESRHYRAIDHTFVMALNLRDRDMGALHNVPLTEDRLEEWLDIFGRFRAAPPAQHLAHKSILEAIPARCLFASLRVGDRAVACGLGVLEDNVFGLFDLITAPEERRKGYGTRLVLGMLRWARDKGAAHTYLQVMRSNHPACSLYGKLGFETIYEYWYRVPQT